MPFCFFLIDNLTCFKTLGCCLSLGSLKFLSNCQHSFHSLFCVLIELFWLKIHAFSYGIFSVNISLIVVSYLLSSGTLII